MAKLVICWSPASWACLRAVHCPLGIGKDHGSLCHGALRWLFRCVQLMASFAMSTAMPLQGMVVSAPFALAHPMASSLFAMESVHIAFVGACQYVPVEVATQQLQILCGSARRGAATPGLTQTAVAVSS